MRSIFGTRTTLGADAPMLNCPDGQIGAPGLGFPCQPIPGAAQSAPAGGINPCPAGQWGFPPLVPCMAVPGQAQPVPAQAASPCPPGMIGFPPAVPCQMVPAMPGQLPAMPGQLPALPGQAPPVQQASAAKPGALPSWALPVGIGAAVLLAVVVLSPKKGSYKSNPRRRRRVRRHRRTRR